MIDSLPNNMQWIIDNVILLSYSQGRTIDGLFRVVLHSEYKNKKRFTCGYSVHDFPDAINEATTRLARKIK